MKKIGLLIASLFIAAFLLASCGQPKDQPGGGDNQPPQQTVEFDKLLIGTQDGIVSLDIASKTATPLGVGGRFFAYWNGKIYAYADSQTINVYDLQGNQVGTITHPAYSNALWYVVVDDNRIALLDNGEDKVHFINFDGNLVKDVAFTPSAGEYENLDGVVVGGKLVISEDGHKHVFAIDLNDYSVSTLEDLSDQPGTWLTGIAYHDGSYFTGLEDGTILKFSAGGTATEFARLPHGISAYMTADDENIYVSSGNAGYVYAVSLADGSVQELASGLNKASSIAGVVTSSQ